MDPVTLAALLQRLDPGTLTAILCTSSHKVEGCLLVYDWIRRAMTQDKVVYAFSQRYPSLDWALPHAKANQLSLVDLTHHGLSAYADLTSQVRRHQQGEIPNYYFVDHTESTKTVLHTLTRIKELEGMPLVWVWNTPSDLLTLGIDETTLTTALRRFRAHLLAWGDRALLLIIKNMHQWLPAVGYLADVLLQITESDTSEGRYRLEVLHHYQRENQPLEFGLRGEQIVY